MDALSNGTEAPSGSATITVEKQKTTSGPNMEHSQTNHQKTLPDG